MSRRRTPEQAVKHRDEERIRKRSMSQEQKIQRSERNRSWYASLTPAQREARQEARTARYRASRVGLAAYNKGPVPTLDRDACLYLAGLYDGEGCFMVSTAQSRGKVKYNASVRLAMTDRAVIEWVANKLGRPVGIHGHGKNVTKNARVCYRVVLQNQEAIVSFLEQLTPFLIVKKQVALAVIEFCDSRRVGHRAYGEKKAYTESDIALFCAIKQFNRVGASGESTTVN